jgi:hypothetical protein
VVWDVSPLHLDAMDVVDVVGVMVGWIPVMCLEVVELSRTFVSLFIGILMAEAMVGVQMWL